MIQSFYNGLSGMFNFSRGLDTISNNVSNMNTAGFRGSDTFYRSVSGDDGGYGASFSGAYVRTKPGELRQTGNPFDLALNGSGYFVLRDDAGKLLYTRAGKFEFRKDVLVDTVTGYEVMAMDKSGAFARIDISGQGALPAQATTMMNIKGIVNATIPANGTKPNDVSLNSMKLFDASGEQHTLKMQMKWAGAGAWQLVVKQVVGTVETELVVTNPVTGNPAEIRYNTTTGSPQFGTPLDGFNKVSVALPLAGGTQHVVLNFGDPGTTSMTRQATATGSLTGTAADGRTVLAMSTKGFDETGRLKFGYSNNITEFGPQIALAFFGDENKLVQAQGSMYEATPATTVKYGRPGSGVFGKVATESLELSNVDLTQEFADMMVVQRGYQASSRVMSVANELVEQLYNNSRGA